MRPVDATYAVFTGENQMALNQETLDLDTLPPMAVAVEAETSVISAGTELAIYTGIAPGVRTPGSWNAYPWRPGYGLVGRVLETGVAVERVKPGERVFCFGKHASRQFYDMTSGKPFTAIFTMPDDLPAEKLVMLRMALVAIHAPQMTTIRPGDTVAIFGLGVVGNLAAQLYRMAGMRVIGLDPVKSRCEAARLAGIDTVVEVVPEHQLQTVRDLTGGRGAHVTVDAVGHSAVLQTCITACADNGQVMLLGSPRVPYEGNLTQVFREIHLRWLTVRGALEWRHPPYAAFGIQDSVESNLWRLVDAFRNGQLNLDVVTSHIVDAHHLNTAYEGLLNQKDDYLGVVVDWRQTSQTGVM